MGHDAYNEYVELQLIKLDEMYGLSKMLETKSLDEIRECLIKDEKLELLQKDIMDLNNKLREANQEGIDLYIKHPNNTNNKDYTDGDTISMEDANKNYREQNFGENENEKDDKEGLKSEPCGGKK